MTIAIRSLALLIALLSGWVPVSAQSDKQVKVLFEFRQSATQNRGSVDGSGKPLY